MGAINISKNMAKEGIEMGKFDLTLIITMAVAMITVIVSTSETVTVIAIVVGLIALVVSLKHTTTLGKSERIVIEKYKK